MVLKNPYRNYGIIYALSLFMFEVFNPVLSQIILNFDVPDSQARLLVTIFLGAAMIAEFCMPIILIYLNTQTVMRFMWWLGFFSSVVCFFAKTYEQIFMCRLLTGLSAGGLIILTRITIEQSEKNIVKGYHFAVGAMLGFHAMMAIVAPIMASYVIFYFGWQSVQWLCVLGLLVMYPTLSQWSQQLKCVQWQWKDYKQGLSFLYQQPKKINAIILAGFISSLPMCEVMFSSIYLTMHHHIPVWLLGLYLSGMKVVDACVRFKMPYVLNDYNASRLIKLGIVCLILGVGVLMVASSSNGLFAYLMGCMLLNITANALLIIFSVDVFVEVAKFAPITGNAVFGSLQFGCSFLAAAILNLFLKMDLLGFVIYLCLFISCLIVLLLPRYRAHTLVIV